MHSPHDDNHSMFIVNLKSSATEVVEMPTDIEFDHPMDVPGGYNGSFDMGSYRTRNIERRFAPSNGYKYILKLI